MKGQPHSVLALSGANTSRDEFGSFNGGTEGFFKGLVDDLTMSVIGDNSSDAAISAATTAARKVAFARDRSQVDTCDRYPVGRGE